MAAAIKSIIDLVLNIDLPLTLYTDSKLLYDCLVKLGTTQEKRLIIDIICLWQAYKRKDIVEVKWIKGESNPINAITKSKPSNALERLINTNTLQLDVEEWVERDWRAYKWFGVIRGQEDIQVYKDILAGRIHMGIL